MSTHVQNCARIEELPHLLAPYTSSFLIADETAWHHHAPSVKGVSTVFPVPAGERCKTMQMAQACWEALAAAGADRRTAVIGFGGGAACDLAGFVASCYMRGVDLILVPTTLLAMVDAAIGGKNGVNLSSRKNLIGTLHPPRVVITDLQFLNTLPQRAFHAGIAEVIKTAMAADAPFFAYLEEQIDLLATRNPATLNYAVAHTAHIKQAVVKSDPTEKAARVILNWGHTFAHALEAASASKDLLHGEAVAIGMHCAAHLSVLTGHCTADLVQRQAALCRRAGLPTAPPPCNFKEIVDLMHMDKKATAGQCHCVLAKGIGDVALVHNISRKLILHALEEACRG